MLASLSSQYSLRSVGGLKRQHNICTFSLFTDQLSLPTTVIMLPVISTLLLSQGKQRILVLLVPRHFPRLVLGTLLKRNPEDFRNVHHVCESAISRANYCNCFNTFYQCSYQRWNSSDTELVKNHPAPQRRRQQIYSHGLCAALRGCWFFLPCVLWTMADSVQGYLVLKHLLTAYWCAWLHSRQEEVS